MTTVNLSALAGAGQQFFDNNGNPLSGGKLFSYEAGTTTPQVTYTTAAGDVPHTNPIILDSAGRIPGGQVWLSAGDNYKFVLTTSTDVQLATWDNITGISGTGITTVASSVGFTGTKGQVGTVQNLADADGSEWIGYQPAGAGAVPTDVQSKLRECVSPEDFGAVGDGVADDTAAIQNAVNYGGIIQGSPNKVYRITQTVDITNSCHLLGLNIVADTAGGFTSGFPKFNATLYGAGVDGLIIESCKITAAGNYSGYSLNFSDCANVKIINNDFVVANTVTSAVSVNLTRRNRDFVISQNTFIHEANGSSDGGGCVWVRNIVNPGNTVDRCLRIVVSENIIVKSSTDEAIWIAGNNGITEQVIVSGNLLTVSNAGTAISVFPGVFASGSTTTAVNFCSVFSNIIRGSLGDTGIKIGAAAANDAGTTMIGINVYDNVIQLTSALFGIRRDTVALVDSAAYNNSISIGSGGTQAISGFTYIYDNKIVGTYANTSPAIYPVTSGLTQLGSDTNRWPANQRLTMRFAGTTVGQRCGFKFSGGFVGEDKFASIDVAPFFTNANGMRLYQVADGADITQAARLNNSGTVSKYFGPANDNDTQLGNSVYRWSTVFAVTGTINTSDEREKTAISNLTDAEKAVATKLKSLVKTFKWKEAVERKGDAARTHIGFIAQEVISAFESEGLNPFDYGLVCFDEFPAVLDGDGNEVSPAGNRYGLRHEQLLAFIIAAL